MLDWNKAEEVNSKFIELQTNINNLCQKYKTSVVLSNILLPEFDAIIEVWFNFNSQMYLLNVVQHIK